MATTGAEVSVREEGPHGRAGTARRAGASPGVRRATYLPSAWTRGEWPTARWRVLPAVRRRQGRRGAAKGSPPSGRYPDRNGRRGAREECPRADHETIIDAGRIGAGEHGIARSFGAARRTDPGGDRPHARQDARTLAGDDGTRAACAPAGGGGGARHDLDGARDGAAGACGERSLSPVGTRDCGATARGAHRGAAGLIPCWC